MKYLIIFIKLAIVLLCINLSSQRSQAGELVDGLPPKNWLGYDLLKLSDWDFWTLAAWYNEPIDKIINDLVHPGGSEFDERRFVDESRQRIQDGVKTLLASPYSLAFINVNGLNVYHREFDFDNNSMDFQFQSCINVGEIGKANHFAPSIHIYIPLAVTGDKPWQCEATVTVKVKDAGEGEKLFNMVESEGASASLKCLVFSVDDYRRPMNLACWVFDIEIKAGGGDVIFNAKGSGLEDPVKWTFEYGIGPANIKTGSKNPDDLPKTKRGVSEVYNIVTDFLLGDTYGNTAAEVKSHITDIRFGADTFCNGKDNWIIKVLVPASPSSDIIEGYIVIDDEYGMPDCVGLPFLD